MTLIEKDQIKQLSDKIDLLYEMKAEDSKVLNAINNALLGDKYNVNGGIIRRVEIIEDKQRMTELNQTVSTSHWRYVEKWGGFVAGCIAIIYEIVTAFIKK